MPSGADKILQTSFSKARISFPENIPWNPQLAVDEAERMNGEIKYFAHEFQKTGFPPDWHKDPVTGIKLDLTKHWSQLSDEGEVDIKFIWEPSRFSFVYTLARAYAFKQDERYAEAFWQLTQFWAELLSSTQDQTGWTVRRRLYVSWHGLLVCMHF